MKQSRARRPRPSWSTEPVISISLDKLIADSRASGTLNLANKQLHEVPERVYKAQPEDEGVKWWEVNELIKVDLSHNELQQLPEQFWSGVTAVQTLHLSSNKLQQLPRGISALSALKLLDVSDNTLSRLPDELAALPALAKLSCSNCKLVALPDAVGVQQPSLSAVQASGNSLTSLPAGLASASALVMLDLSNNQLTDITGVAALQLLRELDVSHNKLEVLPDVLGSMPSLTRLDVRNNMLAALPPTLGQATNLLELKAGFNRLKQLPDSFGMLVNLKTLDVRNNLIQVLPDTLCGLQLALLDLTNNSLTRLPPALGHMTSLRSMPLDGNPLKLIRREIWSGPVSALLQHLTDQVSEGGSSTGGSSLHSSRSNSTAGSVAATTAAAAAVAAAVAADSTAHRSSGGGGGELSLCGKGLTTIPDEVWQSAALLGKLDLSNNPLSSDALQPSALSKLQQLRVLSLNSCNLTSWPLCGIPAGSLERMHTLECRNNSLQAAVPADGLACCPALRSLDLSGVRSLQLAPGVFASTPQLEIFMAANSSLQEFPSAVLACTGLRQLNLTGNNISRLPADVTQLTRLTELDVTNNALSNLPPELGLMSGHLRVLAVEGNCLRTIRRAILDKGTAALLEYLKDRIPLV